MHVALRFTILIVLTTAYWACGGDGVPSAGNTEVEDTGNGDSSIPDANADTDTDSFISNVPRAIAVGENATIWELRGDDWVNVEPPIDQCIGADCGFETLLLGGLNSVAMLPSGEALAVAGSGLIIRRRQDGTWERIDTDESPKLFAVAVSAGQFVGVDQTSIYELEDNAWIRVGGPFEGFESNGAGIHLIDLDFAASGDGLAVAGSMNDGEQHEGVLLRFADGSWTVVRQGLDRTLVSVAAHDGLSLCGGYSRLSLGDTSAALLMKEGDDEWGRVPGLPWRRFVTGLDIFDSETAIAVTDGGSLPETSAGGLILRFDGEEWTQEAVGEDVVDHDIRYGMSFDQVCILDRERAFAVGNKLLAAYESGRWRSVDMFTPLAERYPDEIDREELMFLRDITCNSGR